MKYCTQCGSPCDDTAKFCPQCGSALEQNNTRQTEQTRNDYYAGTGQDGRAYTSPIDKPYAPYTNIQPRSIIVAVILSIVTCGIYGIYWMIKLNDEVNELADEIGATSGGIVFLLDLVTCGIYGIYWSYKMGERCDKIKGANESSAILYLILAIVGLRIVNYCLIQDAVNKAVA